MVTIGRCMYNLCKYYTTFYNELQHLQILVSEGGILDPIHLDFKMQIYAEIPL